MFRSIFAAAALLACSPALAQVQAPAASQAQPQQQQQPQQKPAKPKKPRLICQEEEATGSRLQGHRVCMTAEQWQEQTRQAQDAVGAAERQSH